MLAYSTMELVHRKLWLSPSVPRVMSLKRDTEPFLQNFSGMSILTRAMESPFRALELVVHHKLQAQHKIQHNAGIRLGYLVIDKRMLVPPSVLVVTNSWYISAGRGESGPNSIVFNSSQADSSD